MNCRSDRDTSAIAQANAAIEAVFGGARSSDSIRAKRSTPVAVAFKRKRTVAAPSAAGGVPQTSDDDGDASDRRPRVFTVGQTRLAPEEAVANEATFEVGLAQAAPASKRRRRKDSVRAPGVVIRTVFETPEAVVSSEIGSEPQPETPAAPRYSGEYEQIMQALDSVRGTLRAALEARHFRIA